MRVTSGIIRSLEASRESIIKNKSVSRGSGRMQTQDVDLNRLRPSPSRPTVDAAKLARHGKFNWSYYTPITVERDGTQLIIQDGMTRVENARQSGITTLPAYIFDKR